MIAIHCSKKLKKSIFFRFTYLRNNDTDIVISRQYRIHVLVEANCSVWIGYGYAYRYATLYPRQPSPGLTLTLQPCTCAPDAGPSTH